MKKLLLSLAIIPVLATPSMASLATQHQSFGNCNSNSRGYVKLQETTRSQGHYQFTYQSVSTLCVINGVVYNDDSKKVAKIGEVLGSGEGRYRYQYAVENNYLVKYECYAKDRYSDECVKRPTREVFNFSMDNKVAVAKMIESTYDKCKKINNVGYNEAGPSMFNCLQMNGLAAKLVYKPQNPESRTRRYELSLQAPVRY